MSEPVVAQAIIRMRVIAIVTSLLLAGILKPLLALAQDEIAEPPGYIIVTGWYKDEELKQAYYSAVSPILREYGIEAAIASHQGSNLRLLEGSWIPGRFLMVRFPSATHVKNFWWSKEYQKAIDIRRSASALDIAHVKGIPGVKPVMNDKTAYLVFYVDITDDNTFEADYVPRANRILKKHGGQLIVNSSRAETELFEGSVPNASLVIAEFPDVEAMKSFWKAPEYQQLNSIRQASGKWSIAQITPKSAE